MKHKIIVITSVVLALFALVEIPMAIPVAWWLYLLLVPFFAFSLFRRQPPSAQLGRLATFAAVLACIAALYLVPWTSRKAFLHDLYSIRRGMTETDVRRIMGRYIEGTDWPAFNAGSPAGNGTLTDDGSGATYATGTTPTGELTLQSSLVFRHSNDGAFNADWGIVTLKDGRVTGVSFSPD